MAFHSKTDDAEIFINEDAPDAIYLSPSLFDCLRSQGFLRQVGTNEPGTGKGLTFGYDCEDGGRDYVKCWLINPGDILTALSSQAAKMEG